MTMIRTKIALSVAAIGLVASGYALALPEGVDTVEVEAESEDHPLGEIFSGWYFRTPETQALQEDDFDNPGFLWVEQGAELWETVDGSEGKFCASCHGDAAESMATAGATMPKWNAALGKPVNLEQQINLCRSERMAPNRGSGSRANCCR